MKVPGCNVLCLVALSLVGRLAPLQGQTNFAVLANDGAWTWFNDPRALFNNGTLYFSYDRSADGKTVLSTLNLQTGGVTNLWTSSLTSDANGQLDIQGTVDSTDSGVTVSLNALVVTANPVARIISTVLATDKNLLLTAQAMYSGQTVIFQESPDLIHWQNASDGVNATTHGPIFTSEFPVSANKMFYRVAYQP